MAGQKVMSKGKILKVSPLSLVNSKKDDQILEAVGIKTGQTLMLMGTAEGNELKAPEKPVVFIEDMTPEERAKLFNETTGMAIPAGLDNLGNTCYMNATLQCLKKCHELKKGLSECKDQYSNDLGDNMDKMLTSAA